MVQGDAVTEVRRDYSADLRTLMAALLKAKPRHVRLISANAQAVRCAFSTEADGFRLGQQVTADLTPLEAGTRLRISSGGEELPVRVRESLEWFLDEVARVLAHLPDQRHGS
ncbi:hypothetical protein [Nocardioides daejeonensis]|uniref:hypothetical protein n=1 Tax=Nocardioides daejeonensis TaxID=1046556 RepID=UPI000D7459A2|nr:hypothetical protein [Nocardioides daejeonensis]